MRLFALCFTTCLLIFPQFANAQRPNILLVIADDLGADSLNLFNGTDGTPTPTLTALSNDGVRFTNCWGSPSCSPARAQILTGRYAFRTGVGSVGAVPDQDEGTIAQAMKAGGYATGCFGKWHLSNNSNGGDDNPNIMGFDDYRGPIGGGVQDYFSWEKVENGTVVNGRNNPNTNYVTSETRSDAVDFINAQGDNPWFCWVAFNAPHSPLHLPPDGLHSENPAAIAGNQRAQFLAMVEAMDIELGNILGGIESNAARENTVVIFVGDNGTPRGVAPGVVRGSKGTLFEGGVHIPCLISGPDVVNPGRTHDALVSLPDLFKTILDIADLEESVIPNGAATDSLSFEPYLTDASLESFHDCQYSERFPREGDQLTGNDGVTIRIGNFKLLRFDNGDPDILADLPEESDNLLEGTLTADQQDAHDQLVEKLDGIRFPIGDVNRDEAVNFQDISPFINLLLSSDYQFQADINQDQTVNFLDISPFIALLNPAS